MSIDVFNSICLLAIASLISELTINLLMRLHITLIIISTWQDYDMQISVYNFHIQTNVREW
jgi:hypothetical protein